MNETKLEKVRNDVAAGKQLSTDDCWFLIEEISQYRDLLRKARYQTIQIAVSANPSGPLTINVIASEEAAERSVIREIRRTWFRLVKQSRKEPTR